MSIKSRTRVNWIILLGYGPLAIYLEYKYNLNTAVLNPILPYFLGTLLFMPAVEAGIGFLVSTSYSTYLFIHNGHASLSETLTRIGLYVMFFFLIVYVKKRIEKTRSDKEKLIKQQTGLSLFKYLVEYSPIAILVEDKDGVILLANKEAENLIGYTQEEFLSSNIKIIIPSHVRPMELKTYEDLWEVQQDKTQTLFHNTPIKCKDSSEFKADVHATWVPWESSIVLRITIIDQTETIRLEEEQLKTAKLEEAVRVRDYFLSTAAHELKTPIAAVVLYADLLEENFTNTINGVVDYRDYFLEQKDTTLKAIKVIQHQSAAMASLINQLLDISVIGSDSIKIVKKKTPLYPFLKEICSMTQLQTTKHTIKLNCEDDIKALIDSLRVEQVMVNLLNNSIKYSPDGGDIIVEVMRLPEDIMITVRDHGIGIPKDKRDKIFTKFFRANESSTISGLGLGLYLSREIMNRHNGTIKFADPPDGRGGIIFYLVFPILSTEHER